MTVDPIEEQVPTGSNFQESNTEYVDTVEASQQWVNWKDELAMTMYNELREN